MTAFQVFIPIIDGKGDFIACIPSCFPMIYMFLILFLWLTAMTYKADPLNKMINESYHALAAFLGVFGLMVMAIFFYNIVFNWYFNYWGYFDYEDTKKV